MKKTYREIRYIHGVDISEELRSVQSLMPIDPEDRERLRQSIEKEGIRDPLKGYIGEDGRFKLLSGWTRFSIAQELNLEQVDIEILIHLETSKDRKEFAISENLDRRQLSSEQKRNLIRFLLGENPEQSDRQIAQKIGVDNKTVGKVRREIPREEFPHVEKKDSLGRKVGEKKPKKTAVTSAKKNTKAERKAALKTEIKDLKAEIARLQKELKAKEKDLKSLS